MREVTGLWNDLEPRSRYRLAPTLGISGCDDAVPCAPEQQCRAVNSMQPAFEPRIVHVGLPAIERKSLATAHHRGQFAFRHLGEVDVATLRVGPSQLQVFG